MILLKESSSKKKKSYGLLSLDSSRRRRHGTRSQAIEVHSLVPSDSTIADAAQYSQTAALHKAMIYTARALASSSPEHWFKLENIKTHTKLEKSAYNHADSAASTPRRCSVDECLQFKQLQIDDESELQGDPLSALLNGSRSPLAPKSEDAWKLAWLKSQLIGENQEFETPFGKRQLVYADHTASGRSLYFIEDFIMRHILPFYGNTHTDDSYVGGRTSQMMKQAEEYIKFKMGGRKDDALIMCGSGCTAAIKRLQEVMGITVPSNMRARVLDMMEASSEERWLVFTGPYEHHSNLLSWRQSLAEVVEIPANEEGEIDIAKLEAELQEAEASGRRKKIGAFSACSNVTGVLTDTRAIARLLHKHGAFVCFDFAAGAPHLQVDMRSSQEDGYDAIVMSPHKLLGGPSTPGILLLQNKLYKLKNLPPSTCGGGTVAYVNGFNEEDTLYYERIEEREEGGTPAIIGKVRCALAFWLKEVMGLSMIKNQENHYMKRAITRLSNHPNIQILGGSLASSKAPILSFLIYAKHKTLEQLPLIQPGGLQSTTSRFEKPLHGRFVVKLLNDLFGIQARGGCSCAGPYGHLLLGVNHNLSLAIKGAIKLGYEGLKPGWARVSLCYSMTDDEVEYILSAINFVADYGQRFLAIYDFDWCSGNWTYSHGETLELIREKVNEISGVIVPSLPKNNMRLSQRLQFRQFLQLAKALAHLLPKFPQPKLVPKDIDPNLLLFYI